MKETIAGVILPKTLTWGATVTVFSLLAGAYTYIVGVETRVTAVEERINKLELSQIEYQKETTSSLRRVEKTLCRLCLASRGRCPYCEE